MKDKSRIFLTNLIYAFGAQAISLILSILMSLIVPKLLGVEDYSFWQLFIFYIGYVGFAHFGLVDGIYLRFGGKKYEELDYSLLSTQFWLSLIIQFIIAMALIMISCFFDIEKNRIIVIYYSLIFMLICNANGFLGYIFQAVNKTKVYSISVMVDKIFFIIAVIFAVIKRNNSFKFFIVMYIIGRMISLIFCLYYGHKIIFSRIKINMQVINDALKSISVGSKLLFANIAGTLILGIGRYFIDRSWGIEVFGKISLSLSMSNFFLQFISQISMVLFPTLRLAKKEELKNIYTYMTKILSVFLPIILLFYIPIKSILCIWIPEYQVSLEYMGLLLPLCIFDGKMQLLCNTYFKVLRKENLLLKINIITAMISLVLNLLATYIFKNMYLVIIFMVVVIALRSIISEIYLANIMKSKVFKNIMLELLLTIIFMLSSWYMDDVNGFILFFLIYSIYLYLNRKIILSLIKTIMHKKVRYKVNN